MFERRPQHINLSFTPAASRTVSPVPSWALALVPRPDKATHVLKAGNEDVETDTIPAMKQIVKETLYQTKQLAQRLKGTTLDQTLRNYTNFILQHIRYVKDAPGKEQLREPSRLIYDGKGDCDCFAITLSSLLTNAKIPHQFKTIKQNGSASWSHIYVVVPKPGGGYYTLDPVTNQFNAEPSFTKDKTFPMALERLSGLGVEATLSPDLKCGVLPSGPLKFYTSTKQVLNEDLVPTKSFLIDKNIPFVDDGNSVAIKTPTGSIRVPSVITREHAAAVQKAITQPITPTIAQTKEAGFGWVAALVLGGIVLSSLGAKKPAIKTESGTLSGVKRKPVRRIAPSKSKRKYATLHL